MGKRGDNKKKLKKICRFSEGKRSNTRTKTPRTLCFSLAVDDHLFYLRSIIIFHIGCTTKQKKVHTSSINEGKKYQTATTATATEQNRISTINFTSLLANTENEHKICLKQNQTEEEEKQQHRHQANESGAREGDSNGFLLVLPYSTLYHHHFKR